MCWDLVPDWWTFLRVMAAATGFTVVLKGDQQGHTQLQQATSSYKFC